MDNNNKKNDAFVNGILVINKHAGVTSHTIVQAVRRLYNIDRAGHAGTLDPMATGVLVVLLGRASKASEYLSSHDKHYRAEMKLGLTTDTQDITGVVQTKFDGTLPSPDEVKRAAAAFLGESEQIPPMYSAIKQGGRKLVDIAREGGEVERQPRPIKIYALTLEQLSGDTYSLDVTCSAGTYIRTLCADIGRSLGCGAVMSALTRVHAGQFSLDDSHTTAELETMTFKERLALLRPVESVFEGCRHVNLSDFQARLFLCGARLYLSKMGLRLTDGVSGGRFVRDGERIVVMRGSQFLGLGTVAADSDEPGGMIKPEKVFALPEEQPWMR